MRRDHPELCSRKVLVLEWVFRRAGSKGCSAEEPLKSQDCITEIERISSTAPEA